MKRKKLYRIRAPANTPLAMAVPINDVPNLLSIQPKQIAALWVKRLHPRNMQLPHAVEAQVHPLVDGDTPYVKESLIEKVPSSAVEKPMKSVSQKQEEAETTEEIPSSASEYYFLFVVASLLAFGYYVKRIVGVVHTVDVLPKYLQETKTK